VKKQIKAEPGASIDAFGPISKKLPIPELDDSSIGTWARDHLFKGNLCYNGAFHWMRFDGKRWTSVERVLVVEYVRLGIEQLGEQARKAKASSESLKKISQLSSKAKINSGVDFLRGAVFVSQELFDVDPDILVVHNGVMNMATGILGPHSRDLYVTKLAGGSYIPGVIHSDIVAMLTAVEPEEALWLQRSMGQGITGRTTPDDKLIMFLGDGSNGKSVIVNSVLKAAGDYAVFLPEKTLMANRSDHSTEKMPLRGARLAFLEELPEGNVLPVKRLKDLVGTPQITARGIGKDNVTWNASHTLFVSTNYLPIVNETDTGTWRRLRVLTFKKRFVKASKVSGPNDVAGDPTLKTRIPENQAGQLDSLLSWLIDGAIAFYAAGCQMPDDPASVEESTQAWRDRSDPVLQFFSTKIEASFDSHIASQDLALAFNREQQALGNREWAATRFLQRVQGHEEIRAGAGGNKRFRKGAPGLSRPEDIQFLSELAAQYTGFEGIRFRNLPVTSDTALE
jgi:putative DNA primase/helicase